MLAHKIMVVEDEKIIALDIRSQLQHLGHDVVAMAISGEQAISLASDTRPDLILMDIVLKGEMDGISAAQAISERLHIPIIFLTAYSDSTTLNRAKGTDPYGFLIKPFRTDDLRVTLEIALHKHQLERKLQESQQWFAKTLQCISDAVIATDTQARVRFMNPMAETLTGWRFEDVEGKEVAKLLVLLAEKTHEPIKNPLVEVLQHLEISQMTNSTLLVSKDGNEFPIEDGASPIFANNGTLLGAVMVFRDVTARKASEVELARFRDNLEHLVDERTTQLRAAREEAERLSTVKTAFLTTMSHEIRSPLNAMMGLLYLLEHQQLEDETRRLVRKVNYSGQSLLAIINDILDFSKIESGQLEIENVPFQLSDIFDQIAVLMSATAGEKSIELIINPAPLGIDQLLGDGLRLQQVLVNLVSNAIKFTDQGEVELSIKVLETHKDRKIKLRFAISDTGIGISKEKQTEIFTAFTQADSSISRRFGGSGLGLAISRQLVELMGGELHVESRLGQGSIFGFDLLFEHNFDLRRMLPELAHLELLVADDSEIARAALINTASSLGWDADAVASGESAYSQAQLRWESGNPYDVVLLDWKMPGLDGLATAQAIKKSQQLKASKLGITPIVIMVSAYSRAELLNEAGKVFVDAILSKPITPSALYDTILEIIEKREPKRKPIPFNNPEINDQCLAGIRVLVVDDSDINCEITQSILALHGAKISLVTDGQEAIDWLGAHPDDVDIVLMDVQMPVLDGYETTRLIRQNPRWVKLPIVALSAGAFTMEENIARKAGMDNFVSKPLNVEHLITVILKLTIGRTDSADRTNHLETVSVEGINRKREGSALISPELSTIDLHGGITRLGDEATYFTYLNKFVGSYAKAGDEIAQLLQQNNLEPALALAHKLKGVSGNLALTKVANLAFQVEAALATGSTATDKASELQNAIDETMDEILLLTVKPPAQE